MDNKEKIQGNKVIKSASKAAGLKSTLSVGGKLYLTSFGKGNDAVLEQQIDTAADYAVTPISAEPSLTVTEAAEARVKFDSKRPNVKKIQLTADNPLHHSAGNPASTRRDILGLKDYLEQRFFGRTFDDNIHIQIIYNILDIEKILAVYATNISAAISHLCDGTSDATQRDLISYLGAQNRYAVFMKPSLDTSLSDRTREAIDQNCALFKKLLDSGRLGYFGFDYKPPKKDEKDKTILKEADVKKKRLYHLLAMAGQLRQWCFHGAKENYWLYDLDSPLPKIDEKHNFDREFLNTLDEYFTERFDEINDHFIEKNQINLAILEEIFPEDDFAEVAKLYYDFIVVKNYKYMGFSIKKLREVMLTLDGADVITDKSMDSVRDKLCKLMDFCIFYRYTQEETRAENNNSMLRAATTEDEKEKFYADEAEWLWKQFRGLFTGFCDKITGWVQRTIDPNRWNDVINLDEYRESNHVSYFAKLLYAMCFFLDGKEINDLLTTLLNKFDNISSFIEITRQLHIYHPFKKEYDFFNNDCKEYFRQINCVRNIARMRKPDSSADPATTTDALYVLGVSDGMTKEQVYEESKKILEIHYDENGKRLKGKNPFRNFISNNVLKSNRFIYVIKFCNPETVHRLVENTVVTKFVLGRMPETQIERYYQSCIVDAVPDASLETRINKLADMMKEMHFDNFKDVKQKSENRNDDNDDIILKERYKAMIGLYLSVVYQLVKNLVYVNSRYVMAFHALERDAGLYGISLKAKRVINGKKKSVDDYPALTRRLLAEGDSSRSGYLARNTRMRGLIAGNLDKADKLVFTPGCAADGKPKAPMSAVSIYRNNIAHLTAVRGCAEYIGDIKKVESYYALYHYLMQRLLEDNDDTANSDPGSVNPHYANLMKYHTYVMDFVKELNTPFGYNLPRYKNLSIQQLFDRNELQPEPKDDAEE